MTLTMTSVCDTRYLTSDIWRLNLTLDSFAGLENVVNIIYVYCLLCDCGLE